MAYQIDAYYANTIKSESLTYTLSQGREPSRAYLTILPQDVSLIPRAGPLVMRGKNTITVPSMYLDSGSVKFTKNGQFISLQLMDKRWAWKYATITLFANIPLPSGVAPTTNRVNAQQLCIALAAQLGVANYDFSLVPTNEYPPVAWKESYADSELETLLNLYGLDINYDPFLDKVAGVRSGNGGLPVISDNDVIFVNDGVDIAEGPARIRVVGEDYNFQCYIELEAVGYDPDDGLRKPIDSLSYKPSAGWGYSNPLSLIPNHSSKVKRIAANQTVFREYRIMGFASGANSPQANIPGWTGPQPATIDDILPLNNYLINSSVDSNGNEVRLRPYLKGQFYAKKDTVENIRETVTDSDELVEGGYHLDLKTGIVTFEYPMFRLDNVTHLISPARLWLLASFRLRDSTTGAKGFYVKDANTSLSLGFGSDIISAPYLTPKYITTYTDDDPLKSSANSNNMASLNSLATALANVKLSQYTDRVSYTKRYRFIHGASTDGLVRQVQWTINREECTTTIYVNNQSSIAAMTGPQRRRASGAFDYYNARQKQWLNQHLIESKPKE